MAYDKTNKRLYATTDAQGNKVGIPLWEIASCLAYFKRDKNGNRNLGMMIRNANINHFAKRHPIPSIVKVEALTDEDRKSINYGWSIRGIRWDAELAKEDSWVRYFNASADRMYYRVLDFDGYYHLALPPLDFSFEDGAKVFRVNTTFGLDFPDIAVRYRLNDTLYSSGMERSELPLEDMTIDGINAASMAGCIPCVIAHKEGVGYRVANGIRKLGSMTSDNIDTMRIELAKYNIVDALADATSEDIALAPAGASNVQSLLLYPKLNNYNDISEDRLYSDDDSTPFGTATEGKDYGNGFVRQLDNALMQVPDGSPLKIISYAFMPAKVSYTYASVQEDGVSFIGTWLFDPADTPEDQFRAANLGGKTLHFSSKTVEVTILLTMQNIYDERIYVKPSEMTFMGLRTTDVRLSTVTTDESMAIDEGASTSLYITGVFEAGSSDDYTFESYTAPSVGRAGATVKVRFGITADKFGTSIFPDYDETKILTWR